MPPMLTSIRRQCLDCSQNAKSVTWCPCDGVHSTRCDLWPFRFGRQPEAVARRYGPQLITPALMPEADVNLDDLPVKPPKVARDESAPLTEAQRAGRERFAAMAAARKAARLEGTDQ